MDALRHVRIATAAAGCNHSLALAEDGTVFSWGGNSAGKLGLGSIGGSEPLPRRVEALTGFKVCSVAAGKYSSCAVTAAGELFTWGDDGRDGQLGLGDKGAQLLPNRVEVLQGEWVIAVSAGVAHTVAVKRGGSVFSWGKAQALGLQDAASVWIPLKASTRWGKLSSFPLRPRPN